MRTPRLDRIGPAQCLFVVAMAAIVSAPSRAYAVGPGTAPLPSGGGAVGLRLLDVPVSGRDDPRAAIYIVDHLGPGGVIERRIEVSSTMPASTPVALYAAAARIGNGEFVGSVGRTADDLSSWTSVVPPEIDLLPGGRAQATVVIRVPADAAPGEQYGVVWAEVGTPSRAGSGVTQVSRVGIRLYVSVGGSGPPRSDFSIDALTAERSADGQPVVRATVHNTGGRALDMSGTLELLNGPGGLRAGPYRAALGTTLAIGDTEAVTIALDNRLPAGPWDALVTMDSGLLHRTGRATITFPASGTSAPVAAARTSSKEPYLAVAGVLASLASVAATLRSLRRHRRRSGIASEPKPGSTASASSMRAS
jgi:hypothetical protein